MATVFHSGCPTSTSNTTCSGVVVLVVVRPLWSLLIYRRQIESITKFCVVPFFIVLHPCRMAEHRTPPHPVFWSCPAQLSFDSYHPGMNVCAVWFPCLLGWLVDLIPAAIHVRAGPGGAIQIGTLLCTSCPLPHALLFMVDVAIINPRGLTFEKFVGPKWSDLSFGWLVALWTDSWMDGWVDG